MLDCCASKDIFLVLSVYTLVGKIYRYTHVHILGLDMVNTIRIVQKKALLELHNRVVGKSEQKRLHVWVGFEMGPADWIWYHQVREALWIVTNKGIKIKKCLISGSFLAAI